MQSETPITAQPSLHALRLWTKLKGKVAVKECAGCAEVKLGAGGPPVHPVFYCQGCWLSYFEAHGTGKDWRSWDESTNVCEERIELAMHACQSLGGTFDFPPFMNNGDRWQVHEKARLHGLRHQSFGEEPNRFIRVSALDAAGCEEAAAVVDASAEDFQLAMERRRLRSASLEMERLRTELQEAQMEAADATRQNQEMKEDLKRLDWQLQEALGSEQVLASCTAVRLHELQEQALTSQQRLLAESKKRLQQPPSASRECNLWQYEAHEGSFLSFEPAANAAIEAHVADYPGLSMTPTMNVHVTVRGDTRIVVLNFQSMTQTVFLGSGQQRRIRRADALSLRGPRDAA
eukprot:TRINITY_DN41917_c0_g1_i1.p1 TRINITY_DN41917_c0_g1~~TRINITY_DN41917_c0_g1_i1.p1  ORF type:complete len:347 (-),score=67.17 TRINITY_DN41917_c0_g1_i1:88-1128(-)